VTLRPRGALWAYAIPAVVAAVAVQYWFRGDIGLAGGDLAPPVTPSGDYITHWNQLQSGAGSPGASIVSLPYSEGLRLFNDLGLEAIWFQRFWLTVLFAASSAAVVFLAQQLLRSPLAAAVAGLLATFNAYHLTTQFDPLPLVAIIAAAFLGGLMIQAGRLGSNPHPILFAMSSLMLGVTFANPPHVVLVLGWLVVSALLAVAAHGRAALKRITRFLLVAGPLSVLFNLWWIVPALLTITGPVFAEQYAAPGASSWAWTHARNSLPNILSLTSLWAWASPEYFPFVARLQRAPFPILQYTLPAAACVGLICARKSLRRLAWVLGGVSVFLVWFLKGLHAPLSTTNLWFYDHFPGAWLFRDPSKARLALVLVFSLLAGIAVVEAQRASHALGTSVATLFVVASLAYAYPLLTGSVIADERPLLPPSRVTVPSHWTHAAAYLNSRAPGGKVLVLPRLDYYQAPTTWGYYGASFLHQLIHDPVIEPTPGGYFAAGAVAALVDSLQDRVLKHRDVTSDLQALGVHYVVLRSDLDTSFPGRSFVDPARLAHAFPQIPQLRHVRSFGFVDLYETRHVPQPEVYAATPVLKTAGANEASLYRTLRLGAATAIVRGSVRDKLSGVATGATRLAPRLGGAASVTLEERTRETTVRLARAPSRAAPVHFPRVAYPVQVIIGDERGIARDGSTRLQFDAASATPLYRFARADPWVRIGIPASTVRNVGDCNHYDDRNATEVGLRAALVKRGQAPTVQLAARDHAACIAMPIRFLPDVPFLLRLEYRTVRGTPARLCVWEAKTARCATLPPLDSAPGWHKLKAIVRPTSETGSLLLFLYADGGGDTSTVTEYRNLSLKEGRPHDVVALVPLQRLPGVSYRRVAPYEFKAHVTNARRPFLLVAAETYAPGWHIEADGRSSRGVEHLRVNGYANGWRVPWKGTYDVTITYRPERVARAARWFDVIFIPLSLMGWIGWRGRRAFARTTVACDPAAEAEGRRLR
jgi:arabinofuranan 3-O-arabinosyltransferase